MKEIKVFLAMMSVMILGISLAEASPGITYHGRLMKPNGQPVTSTSVQFRIQLRTPSGSNCLLYEEIQTKDLSAAAGVFSLTINDGTATSLNTEPYTLDRAFQNRGLFTFDSGKCAGTSGDNWIPGATDGRLLYVAFNDGSFSGWEPLPPQTINYVPMALEAVSLGGHKPSNFFRVIDGETLHTLPPWSSANYQKLLDLIGNTSISGGNASIGGTSSGFTGSLSGDVTGGQSSTSVVRIQGNAVASGLPGNGQVLTWNHALSRWEPMTPSSTAAPTGAAGGDLTGNYPDPTIANNVVTTAKINDQAVTPAKLQDGSANGQVFRFDGTDWEIEKLNYRDLVNNFSGSPWPSANCLAGQAVVWLSASDAFSCQSIVVNGSNIADGSVDTADLADGAVTTAKIQDGAVTNQKITSLAVNKITSGTGLYLTYAPDGVACANGEVLKKTANGWECGADNNAGGTVTSVSGTAPIAVASGTTTPVISLNAAGVQTSHLADASVTEVKLAANSVTSAKIVDGTIVNADIADGTIASTKLASSVSDGLWSAGGGNVYRSTGSVGIGTATTGTTLDVLGVAVLDNQSRFSLRVGDSTTMAAGVGGGIMFSGKYTAAGAYSNGGFIQTMKSNATDGDRGFDLVLGTRPNGSNPTERLRILSNGNVGIGTSTPNDKLDVIGRIRASHICAPDGTNCKDLTTAWTAGTVTSISGTAPISVTGTSTPVVSLNAAGVNTTHLANGAVATAKIADGAVTDVKIDKVSVNKIQSGAGLYLTYAPNGSACANGEVLKKTANGWECGTDNNAGGTVTSVTSANADIGVANTTTTPVLTLNVGTGANQILKLNASSQIPAVNGALLTNLNAGSISTGTLPAGRLPGLTGDVVSAVNTNATTVEKIRGRTIANSAPANGQVLKWNNTTSQWEPSADNNAGGTVTSVTGTAPIAVASGTTTPAISLAASGVTATHLANGAVTAAKLATAVQNGLWTVSGANVYRASGNVGIGTAAPNSILDVRGVISGGFGALGTSGTLNWSDATNTRGSSPTLLLGSATSGPGAGNYFHPFSFEYGSKDGTGQITQFAIPYADSTSIDGGIYFRGRYSGTWSAWRKVISEGPSGNVGIGVASPGQKLEVAGNVKATAFISTSDRRLKRNIATVDGLDKVLKLRGVEFDWRSTGEHEIGLIAQEVEEVYPDLVVTDPKTGYKAVKYSSLVSPLIESTKQLYGMCRAQDAQIRRLQEENAALKAKNQDLERRLEAIERHLGLSK